MNQIETRLLELLEQRRQQQRYRSRRELGSAQGALVQVDGRELLNFCSNDYLGLASHPKLREAAVAAMSSYGLGSGASHLVCGHSREHHLLEEELAAFCGRERALVFSTGFMANVGVINALVGRGDAVFEDRLNHASLLDGGLSSGARFSRYRHNDLEHLRSQLQACESAARLIVSDGVFSMDGDEAPLPALARLASERGAWLMVDDAHGFGCEGENGGGMLEKYALTSSDVPVVVGTFGKAFGTFGAFVAGGNTLIKALIQSARSYIYTTAMPPALAAATRQSLRLVGEEKWRRQVLRDHIRRLREFCRSEGLPLLDSNTAIQPLVVGDDAGAQRLSELLWQRGIWVAAIRPPTVPEGTARLRLTLSAAHSDSQLERLFDELSACWKQLGGA